MTPLFRRLAPLLILLAFPSAGRSQAELTPEEPTAVSVAPAGVRRYEPGTWSALSINATNTSKQDSEELVSLFLGHGNSHLQFARRFWLPARSRRQLFVPIRIPNSRPVRPGQLLEVTPQIDAFFMRLTETDDAETYQNVADETKIPSQPLLLDHEQSKAGMMFHRDPPNTFPSTASIDEDAYEAVYKARESATSSRITIQFTADFLPPYPTALESLDQMVISGDRILNDSAGLANLRHWLQRGGRIWIMLDTTSMETVTALLGNEARCAVIDRVELNEFQMEEFGDDQRNTTGPTAESWSSETPVELLRVFPGTDDVQCRIDGWPVAFWQSVGDGEVLFTTLGPRGWVASGDPTHGLTSVARRFFQSSEARPLDPVMVEPLLRDQIGYRIPSRSVAAWVLGLNALAILTFGGWCAKQRRLERLAWFVPVAAVAASIVFLIIGSRNAVSVPSTVATGQIVRVFNSSHEAHISAVSAVYTQDSVELELAAQNGALATVRNQDERGAIRRIVWDDDGRSQWVNLQQPSGVVRSVDAQYVLGSGDPPIVRGTFDANGFHGALTGLDISRCEDALIAAPPAHAAAVSIDAQGTFDVGRGDVLAPQQYIEDGLLSDMQRSRQNLLKQLLQSTQTNPFTNAPSLLVWTPPLDMGVDFPDTFEQSGTALISIPLQIERPAAGTHVSIPATFIAIRPFTGGQGASAIFNHRTGAWRENATNPTRSQIYCVPPSALAPVQIDRATVTVKINAPSRTLKIEGLVDGVPTVLHETPNPNGVLRFLIDRPEALEVDADGGFHLTIVVTETVDEQAERAGTQSPADGSKFENNTWQIDYVRVDAEGMVP